MSEPLCVGGSAVLLFSLAFLLRESGWRASRLFSAFGVVLLLIHTVSRAGELFGGALGAFGGLFNNAGTEPILFILGTGIIFGTVSDICRGVGEEGIAEALEWAGRVEILLISMPTLTEILKMASEILKNA